MCSRQRVRLIPICYIPANSMDLDDAENSPRVHTMKSGTNGMTSVGTTANRLRESLHDRSSTHGRRWSWRIRLLDHAASGPRRLETILIEKNGPGNDLSSSGGSSRIIRRAYGPDEIYTVLANRSLELWKRFLAAENRLECFQRTGVLWMAKEDESSIHAAREIFRRHEIGHQFLNIAEIRALCQSMNVPPGTVALFEPHSGALLAGESVRLVAESAVRSGARYVKGKAKPIGSAAGIKSLEIENDEPVEADVFVFACGSWLPKLFPDVLGRAIFPTRQEVFYFASGPDWPPSSATSLPIWVDQTDPRVPYGFPDIDGTHRCAITKTLQAATC